MTSFGERLTAVSDHALDAWAEGWWEEAAERMLRAAISGKRSAILLVLPKTVEGWFWNRPTREDALKQQAARARLREAGIEHWIDDRFPYERYVRVRW